VARQMKRDAGAFPSRPRFDRSYGGFLLRQAREEFDSVFAASGRHGDHPRGTGDKVQRTCGNATALAPRGTIPAEKSAA